MALSGNIEQKFYSGSGYSLILEWTGSQNIVNNTTTVTARMYLKSNGSGYTIVSSNNNKAGRIIIDGTNYNFTFNPSVNGNQKKLLHTTTKTITHNSDGSKSISLGGYATIAIQLSQGYGWYRYIT